MFSVYYRTPRDEALRVLFLVEQDPARLARLREVYGGRHDVLDALWWRLHPRETSPRGVPDPMLERDGLQRQAFSREGEMAPTLEQRDLITGTKINLTADEHRLRELDAHLAEEARALDAAVARFVADFPAGDVAGIHHAGGSGEARSDAPATPLAAPARATPPAPPRWRRRLTAALAVGLAALLAVNVVLATRLEQVSGRLDSLAQQAITDPLARWGEVDASSAPALQVFIRAQTINDVYPVQLPTAYDLRNVRRLTPEVRTGAFGLYAVLAHPGDICLVAVLPDLSSSSTCSAVSDFAQNGLAVTSTELVGGDDRNPVVREITWRPNGAIVLGTG
ncbi:hypothetical protein [Marisediminicola antarctica]|uniref:Uncharacterized protein n=1 Tax=Marisediminicola antarctica TaxID=674079 RepID=A0A7L5AJ12_9MICO|nr:hypothetical protein [Marisediminicola antarctica]QHO70588.1 hypothetical protein BHD05_13955 [Marisediminicola antarctica]